MSTAIMSVERETINPKRKSAGLLEDLFGADASRVQKQLLHQLVAQGGKGTGV